jgi:hypothetical protein
LLSLLFGLRASDNQVTVENKKKTMMMEETSPRSTSSWLVSTDLDEGGLLSSSDHGHSVRHVLETVGHFLEEMEAGIDRVERDGQLASAIVRGCGDLANAVGGVASQLEEQTDERRRAVARACLLVQEDDNSDLRLSDESSMRRSSSQPPPPSERNEMQLAEVSEDDMMRAIGAATVVLRDVEAALRTVVDPADAEELADVALLVARLFVASLQQVHANLTREHGSAPSSDRIEIIDETPDSTRSRSAAVPASNTKRGRDRVRVLWPPLGPAVSKALGWGQQQAAQQPIVTVALALCLWPAAVTTAVLGTPLVLADGWVQDRYREFEQGPAVVAAERTAAQVYHSARLGLIAARVFARSSIRVGMQTVERHGGLGKMAEQAVGWSVDRIQHPFETATSFWNGVVWCAGELHDLAVAAHGHVTGNNTERDGAAQAALQQ